MSRSLTIGPGALALVSFMAPAVQDVDVLVTRGRELLAQQRADEAEELFVHAWSISEEDPRVRRWIWRTWLQTGRVNEALNGVDRAESEGELPRSDLDYLRGMAFFFLGRTYVDEAVGEPFTSEAFKDATHWLDAATKADGDEYHDAWLALAECAWHSGEYGIGRQAAEEVRRRTPKDPRGSLLFARILFQRCVKLRTETPTLPQTPETWAAEAEVLWKEQSDALETLIARLQPEGGAGLTGEMRNFAADAWLQLGYVNEQQGRMDEAREAFSSAALLWPSGLDYPDLQRRFTPQNFRALLEDAAARAAEEYGQEGEEDALLQWWLGWARYQAEDWAGAAQAYTSAAEKWDPYVDAWVWAARAQHARGNSDAAVAALLEGWQRDASVVAGGLLKGAEKDDTMVADLTRWCEGAGRSEERDALIELRKGTWPTARKK